MMWIFNNIFLIFTFLKFIKFINFTYESKKVDKNINDEEITKENS